MDVSDDFLLKYVKVRALAKPSKDMHRYLHDWMIENRPLVEGEDDFIHHINDQVSPMKGRESASQQDNRVNDFIEKYLARTPGSIMHV